MKTFYLSLLLALCSPLALLAQSADTAWRLYKHPDALFSLRYPPGWSTRTDESGRVFFTSPLQSENDNFRENINISASKSPGLTQQDLLNGAADIIADLKANMTDFELLEQKTWPQSGAEGLQFTYKAHIPSIGDLDLQFVQRFFIKGPTLYTITFTGLSFDASLRAAGMRLLNSIRF